MSYLFDVLIIVILFALFAVLHTFLASNKIKKLIVEHAGNRIAFYRIFYNITSIILFLFVYLLAPKPDVIVYDLHYPYDIVTFAVQIISLFGFLWPLKVINGKEFLGISQIKRFVDNSYKIEDLDEIQEFTTRGAYKCMRHPIYFFSVVFLAFRPTMDLFYLTMLICSIIYFYVGSIYEERKLVEKFGEQYIEYQKRVPRIFPVKFRKVK
jgi:protein-S-isoprenylcysteine O-methyltransferase Ste14